MALAKQTSGLKQRLSQIVEQAKTQAKQSSGDEKAQIQAPGKLEKIVPLCCQSDGTSGEKANAGTRFIPDRQWPSRNVSSRVTITVRGGFIAGMALVVSVGIYLVWLWRPEHQVRLHTENFFHAIDGRNWGRVASFIVDDYHDQWDNDRIGLLERMREGFRWVHGSKITAQNAAVQLETSRATWIGKIMVYSSDDGVMELLDERVNRLPTPFELEWHHVSGKPWDWKLARVSNPAFQIPADMSY
ncbi:MAG: hypothetical protein ACXWBP_04685 [Limisphaerales bacterium]